MTFRSSKAILALGKRTADTATHAIALTALADNGQLQTAANLLSYSASNFSFCFSTTGIDSPHYFSAGAFRCAVRAKLGVGPTSEALEPIRHCPCTIVYNTGLKPFHALSCRLNGATRTRRHHRVVQALAAHPTGPGHYRHCRRENRLRGRDTCRPHMDPSRRTTHYRRRGSRPRRR